MSSALPRPTRRALLGAAAATAAGAATLAVVRVPLGTAAVRAAAAAPGPPWPSPLHTPLGRSAHLLRRLGFGYSTDELNAAASMPYPDLVESLLAQTPQRPTYTGAAQQCGRWNAGPVWMSHMATTTAQVPERMALFWHGLLTSGDDKQPFEFNFMVEQNQLYRDLGLSDLRSLLLQTSLSAAMMRYLDLEQSSAEAPNENFARELMELFTLGPGAYSESDVREAARALSGYRIVAFDAAGAAHPMPEWGPTQDAYVALVHGLIDAGWTFRGVLQPDLHDAGTKTFLGRTGNLGVEEVVDAILAHPGCATFVARKAIAHFAGDAIASDSAFVTEVASRFRASGYDLRTLMRSIVLGGDLGSHATPTRNRFLADDAYRAIVRSPVDLIVAAVRATGYTAILADAYWSGTTMGQSLYEPPNVAGWHGGPAWCGTSEWLARMNFCTAVAYRDGSPQANPDAAAALATQLDGVLSPSTASAYSGISWAGQRWTAILASPEFQLK